MHFNAEPAVGPASVGAGRPPTQKLFETSPEVAWEITTEPEAFYVHWLFGLIDSDAGWFHTCQHN